MNDRCGRLIASGNILVVNIQLHICAKGPLISWYVALICLTLMSSTLLEEPFLRVKMRFSISTWLVGIKNMERGISLRIPAMGLREVEACKLGAPDNKK